MPAYNAAKTLRRVFDEIPRDSVHEIILVDDASQDGTVEVAAGLPLKVVVHEHNRGYGGNQKTCYKQALAHDADVVVMLHPDYQYDPADIPRLVEPIANGSADAVFGSRMMNGAVSRGGMPWWKVLGNRFLTAVENLALRQSLSEYHSGYRAYSAELLRGISFEKNDDGFVFDQQIIVQVCRAGFRIQEVPVTAKYFEDMSSVSFGTSVEYGLRTLATIARAFFSRA